MKKILSIALLVLPALLLLGGCAMEPAYRYNVNAGGGYYYGQSPYGNADTVVVGGGYAQPWGWGGWGPGYSGWYGYPGWSVGFSPWVGFGATYYGAYGGYYGRWNHRRHWRRGRRVWPSGQSAHRPPPARAMQRYDSRHNPSVHRGPRPGTTRSPHRRH